MRDVAQALELTQVQHPLLELGVLLGRLATAHGYDVGPFGIGEEQLENVAADQASRARNES